ncbi:MAG TPA: hypothetical protein VMT54_16645 [Candidatus Cybelea sp.]|nr:hypothetical protein [Candidatus Cybelea sp.]
MSDNDNRQQDDPRPVVLDEHRGLVAQRDIDARRQQTAVHADHEALRERQALLEKHLFANPATTWMEAAEKCAYLLDLFAQTGEGQDPRYKHLILDALEDLNRLAGQTAKAPR